MYRRLFFSKVTAAAAAAGILLLNLASLVLGRMAGDINWYDYFDICVKLMLTCFLYYGYARHDLITMQAGCSGLLLCMLYDQAGYALDQLLSRNMESFIVLGFWGSFFLAGELMLCVLEIIIVVNYYVIHILRRRSLIRIALNQTTILILFAFLLLQLFVNTRLMIPAIRLAYFAVSHLGIIAAYVLIACAELILTLDRGEEERHA